MTKSILKSTHARFVFSTALATMSLGALGGYGSRTAYAGSCGPTGTPGTYACTGAANNSVDQKQELNPGGALTVTTTPGFGIAAGTLNGGRTALELRGNGGLSFTDTNNSYIEGTTGIDANNRLGGALSIISNGTVVGSVYNGIHALNNSTFLGPIATDLTIYTGVVTGNKTGIRAQNAGTGALTITSVGTVTGNDFGIVAYSNGSGLTISAEEVSGGILATLSGTGALSVTANEDVTATNLSGIIANTTENTTDITVTAAAVTGNRIGIYARHSGSGALSIESSGPVIGATYDGIRAETEISGTDMTISTAAVSGEIQGIRATNRGTGVLSITATGQVTGHGSRGISATNLGTNLSISVTSAISTTTDSTVGVGIAAINLGSGSLSITSTDLVSGDAHGIFARNYGSAANSLTISGAVTGGTGVGIETRTYAGNSTIIILNAGADISATSGVAITNNEGNSTILVGAGASVSGAIKLGDGTDNLIFDGGDFSNVTQLDGNAGNDALTFKNVSGEIAAADVLGWETVTIGSGAEISFGDGTLNVGLLNVLDGGTLISNISAPLAPAPAAGFSALGFGAMFSPFEAFNIVGDINFETGSIIDFVFDIADFSIFEGLSFNFLNATGNITGLDNAIFNIVGLDGSIVAEIIPDSDNPSSFSVHFSEVGEVPLPPSLVMFGTGLLGMAGFARLRRRRKSENAKA